MSSAYRVAPLFLIRIAGVPFEAIEKLATPETIIAARELIGAKRDLAAQAHLAESLQLELSSARAALWEAGRTLLARYLVFAVGGVRHLLAKLVDGSVVPAHRNSRSGDRERHLLLYLQRIAAKNDTFSEFGPSGWGKVEDVRGIVVAPRPGIAAREAFLERWTAHDVARAINAEIPEAKMQVPALEPHAFAILCEDVQKWKPEPARERWMSILQPIAALAEKFVTTPEIGDRQAILDEARLRLDSLGSERTAAGRSLYSAGNPIGEECFRECGFSISEELINEVAVEAAPWIDLWRDSYAFVASRVAAGLRTVLEKLSNPKGGAIPLPEFLRQCEKANLSLTGPGLVALAHIAFQEVKASFHEQIKPHADKAEHKLSVDECHVVRRTFEYPKFDEYTYPSADLQIAAESVEAVALGDYQWILGELHPPVALLQHCMYWACPDKAALTRSLISTTLYKPNFHFGIFVADFTAHTTVHLFDALPGLTNFVAPQRPKPQWRTIAPAESEVYVDETTGDVCMRRIGNGEHLGSFARAWTIPLGFHPFQFGMAPQMPRLRCGKVIVQRRSWVVNKEELGAGNYKGVSRDLVVAVERLRAQRELPRYVYIRPTEQALRRSGVESRDKDTKPVFIDFESYLFMEIFYRWLAKAGEVEVTEMSPDPDHLLWREPDGRRTFELRTLIVPS